MFTRWDMMSEKQLSILVLGRSYTRGNRQIIRISRTFACISESAGSPQLKFHSPEPARPRMLTVPFHGTFFPLEVHSVWQLSVQAVMKIASEWRHFRFGVFVFYRCTFNESRKSRHERYICCPAVRLVGTVPYRLKAITEQILWLGALLTIIDVCICW